MPETPPVASLPGTERQPDPVRIGLLALATDLTLEHDLAQMLPASLRLHVTRLAFANPTTPANLRAMLPGISAATELLVPGVPLAAIGFGCTSGAVVIGDAAVSAAVGAVRPGVPVCTPAGSAVQGLRALGLRRIALLTPYVDETTAPVAAYFAQAGLEVVHVVGLGMEDDRDIARLDPATIIDAAHRANHPQAEALFVSCTSTPILPLITALEGALGKPVLSSNQALGWAMLAATGVTGQGPGRLFAPPAAA
ncbi:MAG: ectoine utilization protein EutA [Pararhodobacter sp.]|nr:ectoine utilization protein EutA [Pararhodobacter sp.]